MSPSKLCSPKRIILLWKVKGVADDDDDDDDEIAFIRTKNQYKAKFVYKESLSIE